MKKLIIDSRASLEEKSSILSLGYKYIECPLCQKTYEAISGHPDILLHIVDNKNVVLHKDIDSNFTRKLQHEGIKITYSENSLTSKQNQLKRWDKLMLLNEGLHSEYEKEAKN